MRGRPQPVIIKTYLVEHLWTFGLHDCILTLPVQIEVNKALSKSGNLVERYSNAVLSWQIKHMMCPAQIPWKN